MACAAPLTAAPEHGARRVVTIVFSDLVGSTALGESRDSESLREVLTRYFDRMREAVEHHGGVIEKYIGDAVMAVFGLSHVHEDDALRAVRAAAEMQEALRGLNEDLEKIYGVRLANRTGVNTGEVVAGDPEVRQRLVTGDTVNTAARLEQAAGTNEVLLGEATYRLVRPWVEAEAVEPLSLKGKAEPVPAWRLVSILEVPPAGTQLRTPLVGREIELSLLEEALERARHEEACVLVPLIADAGVGKTRLVHEFLAGLPHDIKVLRGRCLSYGEGVTFWPVAEALRDAARIEQDDTQEAARGKLGELLVNDPDRPVLSERLASVLGFSEESGAVEEIFWAVRRAFEGLAASAPLVVVFEDIHWAEPTMLDLLEHLVSLTSAPLLLLAPARPELLEIRPGWEGNDRTTIVRLEPLNEADVDRMVENLLASELPDAIRSRIRAFSQGNPLYCEQIVSMWIDEGLLQQTEGEWRVTGTLPDHSIPPSISALLAARLDRLDVNERAVIERAAIVGLVFYRGALEHLLSEDLTAALLALLLALTGKQFIGPEEKESWSDEAYRFLHVLIRESVYSGMLKRTRAELHERFAEWLQRSAEGRLTEVEEIVGYHLEQAYRYLEALGPVDEHGRSIATEAGHRLGRAGRRAFARGDAPAAVKLLSRGVSLLPPEDPMRLALGVDLGEALGETTQFGRAEALLREAEDEATKAGDRAMQARAGVARLYLSYYTNPEIGNDVRRPQLEGAVQTLEELGDEAGLAEALGQLATMLYSEGSFEAGDRELARCIEHAHRVRDARREGNYRAFFTTQGTYGPTPVDEAVRRCEETMHWAADRPFVQGKVLRAMARLRAMEGSFEEARDLLERSIAIFEDLGLSGSLRGSQAVSGFVELMAGDPVASEHRLRVPLEAAERSGEDRLLLQMVGTMMADALCAQERYREADRLTEMSRERAHSFDVLDQVEWRSIRARVLAGMGRLKEAEALASEAVAIAEPTEALNTRGDASMVLAEIMRARGHPTEAASLAEQAVHLFGRKGNLVEVSRAQALLDRCLA